MHTKRSACSLRILFATVFCAAVVAVGQDGEGGYDAPYFQADFTQDLNSWTSALVNPALLHRVNQMHASMAFYRWGLDRGNMGYQDFSLFYPIRMRHTAGLTILHARNSMDRVTPGASGDGQQVGQVSYQDLWLVGNYGARVLPWLMLGGNLKFRSQAQFGQNAFSRVPGLDVGVYINPFDHYQWGDIGISLMAQDIMPTQTPWEFNYEAGGVQDVFNTDGDLVTVSRGRMGVRYAGLNDNLVVSIEMLVDNAFRDIFAALNFEDFKKMVMSNDDKDLPSRKKLAKMFPVAVRWGFHAKYMFIPQIWFKGGWTNNNIPYLGFQYNLLYPLPEMVNFFTVDYNFGYSFLENSSSMDDERGLVMMLRASADFGRTREQKESKRLYDRLVVAPMDAYQEAMRLYVAERYWEAAFAFGKLISVYPNFYLNDKAAYYMGDCYKNLYLNSGAREIFKVSLDEYTTSDMRAHYLYGLMSLDYREGNYVEAMRNYSFITSLYTDSELVGEAEYLAGMIAFETGDPAAAKTHLERVRPEDRSYIYALYTLSIVNYEADRHQAAIKNLMDVMEDTTSRVEDQRLQLAAAIKLGHIYFEMGDKHREAVEAYSRVPENTRYYGDEALLGIAWTLLKAGQPQPAQQRAERIISRHPQSPFVPEAHLIVGYALMLQRRYDAKIPAFERALSAAKGDFVSDQNFAERSGQFDKVTKEFEPTAEKIRRNALRRPTPRTVEERPELQKSYEEFARENQEFFEYKMLARSHKNFFMRKDEVMEDAEYALANATSLMMRRSASQAIQATVEAEGRIDVELERLRQMLEEVERGGEPETGEE